MWLPSGYRDRTNTVRVADADYTEDWEGRVAVTVFAKPTEVVVRQAPDGVKGEYEANYGHGRFRVQSEQVEEFFARFETPSEAARKIAIMRKR